MHPTVISAAAITSTPSDPLNIKDFDISKPVLSLTREL